MRKKTSKNPLGAGRNKNEWTSSRMVIPDPIKGKVKDMVNEWIKEQKK
jgi:hypothetical protein